MRPGTLDAEGTPLFAGAVGAVSSGTLGIHPLADKPPYAPVPPSIPCATSEQAAELLGAAGAAHQRARVLAVLRAHPDGLTASEVEALTGISGTRARLLELSHGVGVQRGLGLIERTAETRVVPGHRGAFVWRVR